MGDTDRAREIEAAIAAVLLREWDPIGVRHEPGAQDEYDGYVGGVYRLLASGATAEQVADHLARIEREQMGFERTTAGALLPVARTLRALDVGLRSSRPAV